MDNAVPTIGSSAMLGTSNTMACLLEAMGKNLLGTPTIHAVFSEKVRSAYYSGETIMNLARKDSVESIAKEVIKYSKLISKELGYLGD